MHRNHYMTLLCRQDIDEIELYLHKNTDILVLTYNLTPNHYTINRRKKCMDEDNLNNNNSNQLEEYRFEFQGTAFQYFRIWFVNTLLSVITLGIFSPWAKVRKYRFFYGNTYLNDENFSYNARPLAILISRIIVVVVLIGGLSWAGEAVVTNVLFTLVLAILLPFATVRAHSFNSRVSSYRNVPFNFVTKGAYLKYVLAFAPYMLITIAIYILFPETLRAETDEEFAVFISAFLFSTATYVIFFFPWCVRFFHRTKGSHHCWGQLRADFNPSSLLVYSISIYIAFFTGFFFWWFLIMLMSGFETNMLNYIYTTASLDSSELLYLGGFIFLFILLSFIIVIVMIFRLYWQGLVLPGGGRIRCEFKTADFVLRITLVNFILTIISLGLLHPWAKVRKARFLAKNMVVMLPANTFNEAVNQNKDGSPLGEEAADASGFEFDVGLI